MMALLFKETAVSAALCALALTGVWRSADRRQLLKNFAWLLAPVVTWSAGIGAMLSEHADSVYAPALNKPLPWLLQLPRRILLCPRNCFNRRWRTSNTRSPRAIGATWPGTRERWP